MGWTYDGTNGLITPDGGSSSSPNLISDAVETIKAGDATKVDIVYAADGTTIISANIIDTVIVLAQGSWTKIDDDIRITFIGTTRFAWKSETSSGANDGGALIHGYRSKLYVNTNTTYHEGNSEVDMANGSSFVTLRDKFGNNPMIIQNASERHDIVTCTGVALAYLDIQGLSMHQIGGATASFKWFMGNTRNLVAFNNLNVDCDGEAFQLLNVSIDNPTVKTMSLASESGTGDDRYVYVNNPTYIMSSDSRFDGNIRSARYTIKNPKWSYGIWNGEVYWSSFNPADDPKLWIVYENTIFTYNADDNVPIQGAKIRLDRINIGTTYNSTTEEHSPYYEEITGSDGKVLKVLLDAYCAVFDANNDMDVNVDNYEWNCQIRKYDHLYTSRYVYENRRFSSIYGTGEKTDVVFMSVDAGVTLTETNAGNLTSAGSLSDIYDIIKYQWVNGSYWDIDIPVVKEGLTLDFDTDTVTFDNSASSLLDITGSAITLKTDSELAITTKFIKVKATSITYKTTTIYDGSQFEGNVYIDKTQNLKNVNITGDLHINTGENSTLSFDNVTVTGNVYNDDVSHTLTINATNGTSITAGDAGTGNGQTYIQHPVILSIGGVTSGNEPASYARCHIEAASGGPETVGTVLMNKEAQETDGSLYKATTTYNYKSDQPVIVRARYKGYLPFTLEGVVTSGGINVSAIWLEDPNYL